jgi:hypothetical protein
VEGKLVYSSGINSNEFTIDCSSLAQGNYLVAVIKDKKVLDTQKLIIQ